MMRVSLLLVALIAVQLLSCADAGVFTAAQYTSFFTKFISSFKKQYTQSRFAAVLTTFKRNLDTITAFNAANKVSNPDAMQLGITEFADLSPEEFAKLFLGEKTEAQLSSEKAEARAAGLGDLLARADAAESSTLALIESEAESELSAEAAAAAEAEVANEFAKGFDWVVQGKVMIPRHQGSCGSCFAHTVAATIESARLIKGSSPAYVSVQAIIDCARYPCSGCRGGLYSCGFSSTLKAFYDEKTAKYTGKADSTTAGSLKRFVSAPECDKLPKTPMGKVNGVRSVRPRNDASFIEGLKKNPMYVGLDAAGLQLYKGGIVTHGVANCSNDFNNHAVMMVGYGSANGVNYYKIRNSWGKTWGEKGYFRIQAGSQNTCGILRQGHYPIL